MFVYLMLGKGNNVVVFMFIEEILTSQVMRKILKSDKLSRKF